MSVVYVIRNQQGLFLGKQSQWFDEGELAQIFRTPHRDVALNQLIEANAKDILQRLDLLQCPLDEKGNPLLAKVEPARRSAPVTFDEPESETRASDNAAEPDDEADAADNDGFHARLNLLRRDNHAALLRGMRRGIEKESLRVTPDGHLAQTPHPAGLGSALMHEQITTDFSEALLEFITQPCETIDDALDALERIHHHVYRVLHAQDEQLWVSSMPCALEGDDRIPLAQYGSSHTATMKTVYRRGLGLRYGRLMQTIAGIHYNLSFPDALWQLLQQHAGFEGDLQDFKTQGYFGLIRNFRRHIWLLLFLFGASPAVCPTFVQGREHQLQQFDDNNRSLYLPDATSLRMGDLGYQSKAQQSLRVCYNSLPSYLATLLQALRQPYPDYEAIGLRDDDGSYRQLSTHLLQIENEFYSTIRPKRVAERGETALHALYQRGVEYLEVRCIDLNPYLPLGIDAETAHFIEVFLLWCLLADSPEADAREYEQMARNQALTVARGRDPLLQLERGDTSCSLRSWAEWLLEQLRPCAELLDDAYDSTAYTASVAGQLARVRDERPTPSAQVLDDMRTQQLSFFRFARQQAQQHLLWFARREFSDAQQRLFAAEAEASLVRQRELESELPLQSFEEYLQQYFSQYEKIPL